MTEHPINGVTNCGRTTHQWHKQQWQSTTSLAWLYVAEHPFSDITNYGRVCRKGARKQSLECGVHTDNQQVWGCSSFCFLTQVESFLNMLYLCKQRERRNNTEPYTVHMLCGNIKIPTSFLSIYASLNSFCCVGVTCVFASFCWFTCTVWMMINSSFTQYLVCTQSHWISTGKPQHNW